MDIRLGIAGLICIVMFFGHTAIGVAWVLPALTEEKVPRTAFGPRSLTVAMIRVTWFVVSIFVLTAGIVLSLLGFFEVADPAGLTLRAFALMWLAAAVMALWIAIARVGSLRGALRLPVPLLWIVLAFLLWPASAL